MQLCTLICIGGRHFDFFGVCAYMFNTGQNVCTNKMEIHLPHKIRKKKLWKTLADGKPKKNALPH